MNTGANDSGSARTLMRAAVRLPLLALLPMLAGFAGDWHWALDLCAHFRAQYAAALGLGLLAAAWMYHWRAALLLLAGSLLNGHAWLSAAGPLPPPAAIVPGSELTLLLANIHVGNPDLSRLQALIERENPDLIAVLELSPEADQTLAVLDTRWPVHARVPQDTPFGIGVWTRLPDARVDVVSSDPLQHPTLRVQFRSAHASTVWITHPFPPIGAQGSRWRDSQLAELAEWLRGDEHAILLGDLNAAPWSAAYHRLRERAGLIDARAGHFPWPTWYGSGGLSRALALPIDHALVGRGWRVVDFRVGPDIGSDHRPLLVKVGAAGS